MNYLFLLVLNQRCPALVQFGEVSAETADQLRLIHCSLQGRPPGPELSCFVLFKQISKIKINIDNMLPIDNCVLKKLECPVVEYFKAMLGDLFD